eukprot:s2239_g8.t1
MAWTDVAVFGGLDGLGLKWDSIPLVRDRLKDLQSVLIEKPLPGEPEVGATGAIGKTHSNLRYNAEVMKPVLHLMRENRDKSPCKEALCKELEILFEKARLTPNSSTLSEEAWSIRSLKDKGNTGSKAMPKDEMVEQKKDQQGRAKPAPVLVKEETSKEEPAVEKEKDAEDETSKEAPAVENEEDPEEEELEDEEPEDEEPQDEEPATKKVAEAKWASDLKQDLEERAGEEGTDLRRAQLRMRASEKEKLEEEREANKEKKKASASEKKAPKPRGRPRRVEGEPAKKSKRKSKKGDEAEDEGKTAAAKSASRKRKSNENGQMEDEGDQPQPKAKAKAKAKPKAGAKRAPRARGNLPEPDKVMEKEMLELLRRYKDTPYNKETDVLHKIYTKKNSPKFYASIYFGRPAGGVKICFPDGSETQKFYFSYAYSSVAVHIYACNKIIATFQNAEDGWWDGPESQALFQLLLVTAGSAQKSFEAMDVD